MGDVKDDSNANSPNHSRRKWLSDVVRNDCSINFHLSKLSNAKFSILYDISLVRDWKRKLKLITLGSERVNVFCKRMKKQCDFYNPRQWRHASLESSPSTLKRDARRTGYPWDISDSFPVLTPFFLIPSSLSSTICSGHRWRRHVGCFPVFWRSNMDVQSLHLH